VKREARSRARKIYREYGLPVADFEAWLEYVAGIEVEQHPNGRAILRHPEKDVRVEMRFDDVSGVTAIHLFARPGETLPTIELPMSAYVAALDLARAALKAAVVEFAGNVVNVVVTPATVPAVASVPTPTVAAEVEPAPGQKPPLNFYRALVTEYNALVSAASRNPIGEISRRRGVPPATIKSWLHRGRKYLKEQSP
jgi:hypothetical protein